MNLIAHPERLDLLAAAHALGTLRGGARRRFETLAREQAPVRAAALVWQSRLASLTELQPATQPDPAVWTRIRNLVEADQAQSAMARQRAAAAPARPNGWMRSLALWRGAAAAGALATVAAAWVGVNLRDQLLNAPPMQYVAVLADDKAAPSMLVTFDPKSRQMTMQRVGAYREASDRSLQLWALPPGGAPRSLGVMDRQSAMRMVAAPNALAAVPALAVSVEPMGGVPAGQGPSGPIVFTGALIEKTL